MPRDGPWFSPTIPPHAEVRPLERAATLMPQAGEVGAVVDRFVLAARLRPDVHQRAERLLAEHSALGAEEPATAFDRHAIFLSETEVIFLFEGNGAHEAVRALFNDPVRSTLIGHWLPLFDGPLHQAPEAYFWERRADG